jgi:hypothetical protein
MSRIAFDAHVSVLSAAATLYFVLRARKHPAAWAFAAISWVSFLFSYTASFVHAGLFAIAVLVAFPRELSRWARQRAFVLSAAGALIVTATLVWFLVDNDLLLTRWRQVEQPSRTFGQVLGALLKHLSPGFLALGNENSYWMISRHAITDVSEMMPWQYGLWVVGAVVAFRSGRFDPALRLLLLMVLIAPIPASLVEDRPAAVRSAVLVLPLTLLSALGFDALLRLLPAVTRRFAHFALAGLLLVGGHRLYRAMEAYPAVSSGWAGWQHGYRDAMRSASRQQSQFDRILITHRFNWPYDLLAFYGHRYPCSSCKVMENPIVVDPTKRELFFLRPEDVTEASQRYPSLRFVQLEAIRDPGGNVSLVGGRFEPASAEREISEERRGSDSR